MTGSLLATAAAAALAVPAGSSATATPYDLDGDSRQELVVGLPWAADGEARTGGAVAVIDGSKRHLLDRARLLRRSELGLTGEATNYAAVGAATASGDFDGDGVADLAVGTPGERGSGVVSVVYGTNGSGAARVETFRGEAADEEHGSAFGGALAAEDLNGDGYADLVVGDAGIDQRADADYGGGAMYVLYGSKDGLTDSGRVKLERPEAAWAAFGIELAVGDTNGDGKADLIEGSEGAPMWSDEPPTPGHFSAWRGDGTGRAALEASNGSLAGGPTSIAVGDVNGDGYGDVVLGIPVNAYVGEDEDAPAGALRLYLGGADGLAQRPVLIRQRSAGVPGTDEQGDQFGASVAVARLDRDRYADIVVGAPGEDAGRGRVTVIRGGERGYARSGNRVLDQGTRGVPGERDTDHRFGSAVTLLDLDGDGRRDLVVAANVDAGLGSVTALRGTPRGFTTDGARRLRLRSLGVRSLDRYAYPETRLGREGGS